MVETGYETDPDEAAVREHQQTIARERMVAAGQATEDKVQEDYFGFGGNERTFLPDGVSYVEHTVFNEGARRRYLNKTNRDVKIDRVSGNAAIRTAPGDDRFALLVTAIVGWNLVGSNGEPMPFNRQNLEKFLDKANPKVIDDIEKDVRKANPWLLAELSIEDIDREISQLEEMRRTKAEEDQGKSGSDNK